MGVRLSEEEAWAELATAHTGILTTLRRDGRPVSLPVWLVAVMLELAPDWVKVSEWPVSTPFVNVPVWAQPPEQVRLLVMSTVLPAPLKAVTVLV